MTRVSKLFLFAQRASLLFLCAVALLGNAGVAYAGFGITPPYLDSDTLTRGSVFQQTIYLVRSDPSDDLQADLTTDVPGAQAWISTDVGNSFIIPAGQTQMPITFTVNVPSNAPFQEYKGTIQIRTSPASTTAGGTGVSIALGAQIDVDLKVVDKIYDFEVRGVRVADMEEGRVLWGLFFPGKISFYMTIKNTGNTNFGPTKVHFDIYDSQMDTLLESTDNTNSIQQVAPFATAEVVAELPTRLPAGSYIAKYTIYKNDQIAQQSTANLSISPAGTVIGYEGYGFGGLSLSDKLKVAGVLAIPIVLLLILFGILFSKWRRRRSRRSSLAR